MCWSHRWRTSVDSCGDRDGGSVRHQEEKDGVLMAHGKDLEHAGLSQHVRTSMKMEKSMTTRLGKRFDPLLTRLMVHGCLL